MKLKSLPKIERPREKLIQKGPQNLKEFTIFIKQTLEKKMKTNSINALRKSSRSKADLFELLIADNMAKTFGVRKDFKKIIDNLINSLKKFENGYFRIEEEKGRAEKTAKQLIKFLKQTGINNVKDIDWIGRHHQTKNTLSDVDLILEEGKIIGLSLKSTRIGLGTQKNLGYKNLKRHLLLDLDKEMERMWEKIRLDLKQRGGYLASICTVPKSIIKNKKRKYPKIEEIGKKYGYPVQVKSVKQSIKSFNNLNQKEKSSFMKLIFGLEEDKRKLLNILAQKAKITIYWNEVYNSIISGEGLQARKIRDVSYGIYLKNKLLIRLQASFTNGIGISAYCQRAFLP